MLRALFFGLPAVTFILGLPLAFRSVPPNRFYGFRASTTILSLDAWYQINFATDVALVAAGVLSGVAVVLLAYDVIALKSEARYLTGILVMGLLLFASLIRVALYSNRF
jgi:hypothetical protein